MVLKYDSEAILVERAERRICDCDDGIGRFAECEARDANDVAGEMEPHDLAAAIAQQHAAVEPAFPDDEEVAGTVVLAAYDRPAPKAALLLLERIEGRLFVRRQRKIMR